MYGRWDKWSHENWWNFDWLDEGIHEVDFVLLTEWWILLLAKMLTFPVSNQPPLNSVMQGIALISGWSRPGFTSRCDSRYSPPAQLLVQWQSLKIRETLVLDSHWPLLAEQLKHHTGLAGFPTTHRRRVCVCVCEGHLGLHSNSDWWAQGRFTPARQSKHFFLL